MTARCLIEVEGLVQGVGFRPFVHDLASRLELCGFVRNAGAGVSIDVEGDEPALDSFVRALTATPPPRAVIDRVRLASATLARYRDFKIEASIAARSPGAVAPVAPDIATCDACVAELFDPGDRRYRYPFLSCSHCGPRLTSCTGMPYDRQATSMRAFPMCEECAREYASPRDRRFHAQTIACARCGPSLQLHETSECLTGDAALLRAVALLGQGRIVAVKGLGGYHLACDATDDTAVTRLRLRKRREAKPLAIMLRDIASARRTCSLTDAEERLLSSPERPIVLLKKQKQSEIAQSVAPGRDELGVMLPYTPLHHLLLADVGRPLVMTSGNVSDHPIAYRDSDAFARLADIADAILSNDREIATACDDSVMKVNAGAPRFLRRSRGFAPRPITLAAISPVDILAMGAHLKNTFCLTKGRCAFVSHHIGDLENLEAYEALERGIEHYESLFDVKPAIVAHDLHPDYLSTQLAQRLGLGELLPVQHHHAHIASCVAEQQIDGPVIGVAFDGSGLGHDAAIWGGEILVVDGAHYERRGHLSYVPLPGGDAATRQPWRSALAHAWSALGGDLTSIVDRFFKSVKQSDFWLTVQILERASLSPRTSSVGRLFDAVSALLGLRDVAHFEGQAAMDLEMRADPATDRSYGAEILEKDGTLVMDAGSIIRAVIDDFCSGVSTSIVAAAFHNALSSLTVDAVSRVARVTGIQRVILSGGVFQNALLTERLIAGLERAGLEPTTNRLVPCNDGGLSLGQAYVAAVKLREDSLCA